jgi:glutamate-1-semialdehyde 2,1-aminomutase
MNWMTRWPGAHPAHVAEATGANVRYVDGNEFIDFCLGDTGGMAAHSHLRRAPPSPVRRRGA